MKRAITFQVVLVGILACLNVLHIEAEDPYMFFTWEVTYGTIYPLGIPQQVAFNLLLKFCMVFELFAAIIEEDLD